MSLAVLAAVAIALSSVSTRQADVADAWRYARAASDQGPAADLGQIGVYGFRIRCSSQRHELLFEYFPGDGGPADWAEEARNSGIDLILYYPTSDTQTTFTVHGPVTETSLTGTLTLTADLADEIAEAPEIRLYGENGPANVTFGGAALALRRVAQECAPPSCRFQEGCSPVAMG